MKNSKPPSVVEIKTWRIIRRGCVVYLRQELTYEWFWREWRCPHLENGRKTLGWGAPEESILVKFHRDRKHEFSPQDAWLSRGNPLISGKPRLVKYYNLARINPIYTPSIVGFYSVYPSLKGSNGPNRGWNSGGLGPPDLKVYTIILPKNTPSWRFTSRKKKCPKITAFQIISRDNHQTFQVPKMKVLTYKSCM